MPSSEGVVACGRCNRQGRLSVLDSTNLLALAFLEINSVIVVVSVGTAAADEPYRILAVGHNRSVVVTVSYQLGAARQGSFDVAVGEPDNRPAFDGEADELAVDGLVLIWVGCLYCVSVHVNVSPTSFR